MVKSLRILGGGTRNLPLDHKRAGTPEPSILDRSNNNLEILGFLLELLAKLFIGHQFIFCGFMHCLCPPYVPKRI